MPDRTVVGERLKQLRGSRTQLEVANALGVTPMAVSQWENGTRVPSDAMKVKIAAYFKKTVMAIFFRD